MKYKTKLLTWLLGVFPHYVFRRVSYAQDGEDLLLASFLEGKKTGAGFFVDVGAYHPYRFSNTAYFAQRGWRGINLEPTPQSFQYFKSYRKRDINLNLAVSRTAGEMRLYEFDEAALNSLSQELSETREAETDFSITRSHLVKVDTLAHILDAYLPPDTQIDFLSVDVEGHDYDVLASNDWKKYRPTLIAVEQELRLVDIQTDTIYTFLADKGYTLVGRTRRTSIYQIS